MERAQVDIQIATAHRFPRPDLSVIKKKMVSFATLDEETAEGCFYVLNRQGKEIRGPSARLAEIACSCYGNLRAASRVIGNDGKMITSQAVCHDLENNVCVSIEVKRRITGKDGRTFSDDMQVVTGNAACSIALRNAVFKVIPMALIRPVYDAARAAAIGDAKTLSFRRDKALETFAKMGVPKERVLAVVSKATVEDIDLAALETLIGLHTAIKDGDTTVDEAFPAAIANKPIFQKPKPADAGASDSPKQDKAPGTSAPEPNSRPASNGPTPEEIAAIERQEAHAAAAEQAERDPAGALSEIMKIDSISDKELGEALKAFRFKIPRDYAGPGTCLRDPDQGWVPRQCRSGTADLAGGGCRRHEAHHRSPARSVHSGRA